MIAFDKPMIPQTLNDKTVQVMMRRELISIDDSGYSGYQYFYVTGKVEALKDLPAQCGEAISASNVELVTGEIPPMVYALSRRRVTKIRRGCRETTW